MPEIGRKVRQIIERFRRGPARLVSVTGLDLIALLLLATIARLYYWRLDRWLINDDEGSYLYAAWRIALGELPYRDFLTPQLPAFLMPGGWLMSLTGPELWPARALATGLTLSAGLFTWATARRLFGPFVALVAGAAMLLQPDVFLHGRSFRSDPFMLAFAALGLWLFSRAAFPRSSPGPASGMSEPRDPPDRRWLAASGVAFGLATLSKLFGPFVLAGCLLWLLADGWRHGRPWRALILDGLAAGLPCLLIVALGLGGFALAAGPGLVFEAVFEHHTRQGAGTPPLEVLREGWTFYGSFLRQNNSALLVFVALAVALAAWPARDRRALLMAWQLPTALAFLLLSREKYPRHLVYLMPALSMLFGLGLRGLFDAAARLQGPARGRAGDIVSNPATSSAATNASRTLQLLALALLLALLLPWRLLDRDHAFRWETGTEKLADLVMLLTEPDELLLSDYSELNFYARRPTTYSGASLSAGAAGSGQITWQRIEDELDGRLPPLVLLDADTEYAHLSFLTDRPVMDAWLAEHYGPAAGALQRAHQRYRVYAPTGRPLPLRARFAEGPALLAAAPLVSRASSGERIELGSAWQAPERAETGPPIAADLGITLRLFDARGREWAQGDTGLMASDGDDQLRLRPTSRWRAGELTSQRVAITLPLGLPPGSYDLLLGLYRRDGQSSGLDAFDAAGSPLGQAVHVGQIGVEPWRAAASDLPEQAIALDLRPEAIAAPGLELIGLAPLPSEPALAGGLLPVDLWWQLADSGERAVALRLDLTKPDSGAVAASQLALVPEDWPAGPMLVRQRVDLPIEPEVASGRYVLGGLLTDREGEALSEAEPMDLGRVEIQARELSGHRFGPPELPDAGTRSARVGDLAELLGLSRLPEVSDGRLELAIQWRALAPSSIPWRLTVQLLGPGDAPRVVVQQDGDPGGGARPTTGWIRGELIRDELRLELPPDLAPGRYPVVAAFYHPLTGYRLPTQGPDALDGDLLRLGELELR